MLAERGLNISPTDEDRYMIANCYRMLGNSCKAADILERLKEKTGHHYLSLAASYRRMKEYKQSEHSFVQALELEVSSMSSEQLYDYYGDRVESNQMTEALKLMGITSPEERLSRIAYKSHHVIACAAGLGALYSEQNQHTLAKDYNQKAFDIVSELYEAEAAVPIAAELLTSLGINYGQMEQYGKAVDHYKQALNIYGMLPPGTSDPMFVTTITNLGTSLMAMGLHSEAMDHYIEQLDVMRELLRVATVKVVYRFTSVLL